MRVETTRKARIGDRQNDLSEEFKAFSGVFGIWARRRLHTASMLAQVRFFARTCLVSDRRLTLLEPPANYYRVGG
jgi:hypothetical protein